MDGWGLCEPDKMAWFWVWVYEEWNLPENGGRELACNFVCPEKEDKFEGECSVSSAVKSFEATN